METKLTVRLDGLTQSALDDLLRLRGTTSSALTRELIRGAWLREFVAVAHTVAAERTEQAKPEAEGEHAARG